MGQYLKGNNMAQKKINNSGCYAHAQISNAYSTKFIRTLWDSI